MLRGAGRGCRAGQGGSWGGGGGEKGMEPGRADTRSQPQTAGGLPWGWRHGEFRAKAAETGCARQPGVISGHAS